MGDYAAWNYFQSLGRPENRIFVEKFRSRYGPQRVTADPMEAAYLEVHLWAQAVEAAGTTDTPAIRQELRNQRFEAPSGPVRIDPENQHTWKTMRLGQIVEAGNSKSSGAQKNRSDLNRIRVPDREQLGMNFFLFSTNSGVAIAPNLRIEDEASDISA